MQPTILLIDDEINNLESTANLLEDEGFKCIKASSGEEALKKVAENRIDVLLCDLKMPSMSGEDVFYALKERSNSVPFIAITAYASVDSAVNLMKMGAFDYLTKPLNFEELKVVLQRAVERQMLVHEVASLRGEIRKRYSLHNIIGKSNEMQNVYRLIESVSPLDCTVLITGESGTGKELVARAIHYEGVRKDKNFIAVNCAAFPESLLESELFGHEKGAFTGAIAQRKGNFEMAHEGSIFLDEIGCASLSTQATLLRIIDTKELTRVGGSKTVNVNVRVIAATNKDLKKESEKGAFRSDLFYRLNVVPIHLPPLRERQDDIPLLVEHFIQKYSAKYGKPCKGLQSGAIDIFYRYHWPGNIRELQNFIERLIITCPCAVSSCEKISAEKILNLLPSNPASISEDYFQMPSEGISIEKMEKDLILATLKKAGWNRSKAAKFLGITRKVLWLKMKKYNLFKDIPLS